jgi:hypothetical protein
MPATPAPLEMTGPGGPILNASFSRSALGTSAGTDTSPAGAESLDSWLVCVFACTVTALGFALASEQVQHWFLIPVTLCGILVGKDAVDWLRGRTNLYGPAGIIGVLGVYFFFVAPLLHVAWDSWTVETEPPPDWRPWLGQMAILNAIGLLVYRFVRELVVAKKSPTTVRTWQLHKPTFYSLTAGALTVSAILQVGVYVVYGGIVGYIEASRSVDDAQSMQGMGVVFLISETFPILAMLAFAVYAQGKEAAKSWLVLFLVLAVFFVLKMFFGGLRGSRSTTVWGLFWALGIIHFWLRPLSRSFVAVGLVALIGFMYFYGLYKAGGLDAVDTITDSTARAEMAEKGQRTLDILLLADLGRSDVQAFVLYRLSEPQPDYHLAWGETYLATLAHLIPRSIWPDRPVEVAKQGTEAQYGRGTYVAGDWVSSKVYGLAGEAMLNFGPAAVPFAFIVLGLVVGYLERYLRDLRMGDPRVLIYPFVVNFAFSILNSDTINLLFFLMKDGVLVFLILWISMRRQIEAEPDVSAVEPARIGGNA